MGGSRYVVVTLPEADARAALEVILSCNWCSDVDISYATRMVPPTNDFEAAVMNSVRSNSSLSQYPADAAELTQFAPRPSGTAPAAGGGGATTTTNPLLVPGGNARSSSAASTDDRPPPLSGLGGPYGGGGPTTAAAPAGGGGAPSDHHPGGSSSSGGQASSSAGVALQPLDYASSRLPAATAEAMVAVVKLTFKVRAMHLGATLKALKAEGIGSVFGTVDVLDVRVSTEALPKVVRRSAGWCPRSLTDRLSTLEIHESISSSSHLNSDHVTCVVLASFIAAIGLLTDGTAFVLAAFFISPLMTMILAVTWGVCVGETGLVVRAVRNVLVDAACAFSVGAVVAVALGVALPHSPEGIAAPVHGTRGDGWSPLSVNTSQILSRGPPKSNVVVSLFVGALSGVAVALGTSGDLPSALAGVALSTSILPPLVNSGLMLGLACFYPTVETENGDRLVEVAFFSMLIYCANVSAVFTLAFLTLKVKRVGGRTLRAAKRNFAVSREAAYAWHKLGMTQSFHDPTAADPTGSSTAPHAGTTNGPHPLGLGLGGPFPGGQSFAERASAASRHDLDDTDDDDDVLDGPPPPPHSGAGGARPAGTDNDSEETKAAWGGATSRPPVPFGRSDSARSQASTLPPSVSARRAYERPPPPPPAASPVVAVAPSRLRWRRTPEAFDAPDDSAQGPLLPVAHGRGHYQALAGGAGAGYRPLEPLGEDEVEVTERPRASFNLTEQPPH